MPGRRAAAAVALTALILIAVAAAGGFAPLLGPNVAQDASSGAISGLEVAGDGE